MHIDEERVPKSEKLLMFDDRLARQFDFLIEIDRLKNVMRRSPLVDGSRVENSAEHSWHLAVMALVLAEYADDLVNLSHVVKMILVHDIVEIDAGDTYAYDVNGNQSKLEREILAAERLFGLLPVEQGLELRALWNEFEERRTPEARFANALDRLLPLLQNYLNAGRVWQANNVTVEHIRQRMAPIAEGSVVLSDVVEKVLAESLDRGYLDAGRGV
ncbi:MAG: HD domain-containing protein [Chloroflexota bacterium]|jgi:putative hydrolases of HD superfamily